MVSCTALARLWICRIRLRAIGARRKDYLWRWGMRRLGRSWVALFKTDRGGQWCAGRLSMSIPSPTFRRWIRVGWWMGSMFMLKNTMMELAMGADYMLTQVVVTLVQTLLRAQMVPSGEWL